MLMVQSIYVVLLNEFFFIEKNKQSDNFFGYFERVSIQFSKTIFYLNPTEFCELFKRMVKVFHRL